MLRVTGASFLLKSVSLVGYRTHWPLPMLPCGGPPDGGLPVGGLPSGGQGRPRAEGIRVAAARRRAEAEMNFIFGVWLLGLEVLIRIVMLVESLKVESRKNKNSDECLNK
jgi:hypothetical protein